MKKPFFIFILMCTLSLPSCKAQIFVRDTDGNNLLASNNYYILPVTHGSGGGVTLAPGRDEPCPNDVAQEVNEMRKGLPLKFSSAYPNKHGIIYESTDLNVIFSGTATKCIPSAVWRVEDYNGEQIVSSHAIIGSPGRDTVRNWFKIEKYENDYKLVYCPSVCDVCRRPYCADIGSKIAKNGRRTLVLNNVPLKVKFKKA